MKNFSLFLSVYLFQQGQNKEEQKEEAGINQSSNNLANGQSFSRDKNKSYWQKSLKEPHGHTDHQLTRNTALFSHPGGLRREHECRINTPDFPGEACSLYPRCVMDTDSLSHRTSQLVKFKQILVFPLISYNKIRKYQF